MPVDLLSSKIKSFGVRLGFHDVGVAPPDVSIWGERFREWLRYGFEGEMDFLARGTERRINPSSIFPWVKSIVVVSMNYYPGAGQRDCLDNPLTGYIANYALNEDYHKVIELKLKELLSYIGALTDGRVQGKIYVDTGPALEKPLAVMAGLGWMGKHSLVVNHNTGSWSLFGVLLLDTEVDFDEPAADQCGECTRCMEACPAKAITAPYILDARKCISYLLGELKGSIPVEMRPLIGNRIFGCDDCQWACPWNSGAQVSNEAAFLPRQELTAPVLVDLIGMDEERFRLMFDNSPIKRIKWGRFLRNVAVAIGNSGDKGAIPALERRLSDPDPVVRGHVEWAISRLKSRKIKMQKSKIKMTG